MSKRDFSYLTMSLNRGIRSIEIDMAIGEINIDVIGYGK